MKIALVGYGKMGQIIDKIAQTRGHEIVARLNESPTLENLNNPDVVIEFSSPESAFGNIKFCLEQGIPVVCGTTGWLEKKTEIEKICIENNSAFLYGSNFSLGVNLFFALNEKLAQLMKPFNDDYHCQLEEIHHIQTTFDGFLITQRKHYPPPQHAPSHRCRGAIYHAQQRRTSLLHRLYQLERADSELV